MLSNVRGGIRRLSTALAISLAVGSAARVASAADDGRKPSQSGRTPWTTSRVVGSPEPPPPFKVVRAFPNLKFQHPLLIARYPEGNRLVVGEQAGILYSFPDRPDARPDLFADLPREIKTVHQLAGAKEVNAVYGLVFHPDFARNRQCFVCYTIEASDPRIQNLADGTRVSRFRVTQADPPRIDPSSEELVITFLQGGHNGGDLHFGPDGMLYISTGDAANPNPPDPFNTGRTSQTCSRPSCGSTSTGGTRGRTMPSPRTTPSPRRPGPGRKSGHTACAIPGV
jgi:glucose/arabinose dehydrogenase